ncbi:SH3 domain-containing protein [Streptococcus hyointestinalis]|uniref:SH3 domain-containing protein n=1 Tax=Streptococcus hyointestinalis TaxID=1337 RepID=UPI0035115800
MSGYIHFKDLGGSTVTSTPSEQSTPSSSIALSSSGTYTFTSRHGIKNAPQQSSSDIAYYDAGSSVRYDKTVISDGYGWLSYISYSGASHYIAID